MLKHVNETRNPIVITQNGEPRGVVLDAGSYHEMMAPIAERPNARHANRPT